MWARKWKNLETSLKAVGVIERIFRPSGTFNVGICVVPVLKHWAIGCHPLIGVQKERKDL